MVRLQMLGSPVVNPFLCRIQRDCPGRAPRGKRNMSGEFLFSKQRQPRIFDPKQLGNHLNPTEPC